MSITPNEVNDILLAAYNTDDYSIEEFDSEILSELPWSLRNGEVKEVGEYSYSLVTDVGGGEGDGEERYVVFKISKDGVDQYFRYDGYYASWDGTTWDDLTPREVKPQERIVVFYE